MDSGHAQQSATRRIDWQLHFAERVSCDVFDAVVRSEQAIDEDMIAF